jgi:hypothetical protein
MELYFGYIGSIMLAIWFWGEVFTFIYVFPKLDFPLLTNYSANIIFLAIILYYKINPKK